MTKEDEKLYRWIDELERAEKKTEGGEAILHLTKKIAERTKREMIEKAVRWLKEEMYHRDQSSGRVCWGEIKAFGIYDSLDEFINDFKQAMENEISNRKKD